MFPISTRRNPARFRNGPYIPMETSPVQLAPFRCFVLFERNSNRKPLAVQFPPCALSSNLP